MPFCRPDQATATYICSRAKAHKGEYPNAVINIGMPSVRCSPRSSTRYAGGSRQLHMWPLLLRDCQELLQRHAPYATTVDDPKQMLAITDSSGSASVSCDVVDTFIYTRFLTCKSRTSIVQLPSCLLEATSADKLRNCAIMPVSMATSLHTAVAAESRFVSP